MSFEILHAAGSAPLLQVDVAVIGAGLVGACIAAELAVSGLRTALIECGVAGAQGASKFSGGIFRVYDEHLALRSLAAFAQRCCGERLAGRRFVRHLRRTGVIYLDKAEKEEVLREAVAHARSGGYLLDRKQLRELSEFPGAAIDKCALFEPAGGIGNVRATARAMADLAAEHGALLFEHAPAFHVENVRAGATIHFPTWSVQSSIIVRATGAWTVDLPAEFGLHTREIPLVRTMAKRALSLPVIDAASGGYAVPLDGRMVQVSSRVRSRADTPSGLRPRPEQAGADGLRCLAQITQCEEDGPVIDVLPGLDAYTADQLPLIGFRDRESIEFMATGMAGIGYKMGPAIGALATGAIRQRLGLGRDPELAGCLLEPFSPERFAA